MRRGGCVGGVRGCLTGSRTDGSTVRLSASPPRVQLAFMSGRRGAERLGVISRTLRCFVFYNVSCLEQAVR